MIENFVINNLYWIIALVLFFLIISLIFYIIYRHYIKAHLKTKLLLETEVKAVEDKYSFYKSEKEKLESKSKIFQDKIESISKEKGMLEARCENLMEKLQNQKDELTDLQQQFKIEFKNLANSILEEKTTKFTSLNQKNMRDILVPFQEKIKGFESKVEEAYDKELRDKISLREEIVKLHQMNEKLSVDASNLTKALKGDVKKQGIWGELVLERILERSGLKKDAEYFVQKQIQDIHGKKFMPDIIINLPDNKQIIIDSKVSIIAYEKYFSTDKEDLQRVYLKEHLNSIKKHVNLLSLKNYQSHITHSLDFILMFIPLESAFSLVVAKEQSLFYQAFEKNIIIVSPSTLLATLRTIANIWKMDYQNKNAKEIARQGGKLYDKFVGFITDLEQVGKKLDEAQKSFHSSKNKLSEGSGNLIRKAENLKKLGINTTKSLPKDFIE